MKIGVYATNNTIYPLATGTIYANVTVAGDLANGLAEAGEDVTLFAPEGTRTKAKLETFGMRPFDDKAIWSQFSDESASYEYENLMMVQILNYIEKEQFDIFQTHCRPFSVVNFAAAKPQLTTVVTVHDPLTGEGYKILPRYQQFENLHLVSISMAQRRTGPELKWAGNIYDGIDIKGWKFNQEAGEYLVFVGRLTPEKGVDTAIQVALKTGRRLKIAGSVYADDEKFFETTVKPYLGDQVEYLGVLAREKLGQLYGGAAALLMPVRWAEPFGLVMIEAMACGTPVIGFNRGSVAEVVDATSGFVVQSAEEMVERVAEIKQIKRLSCRKRVEQNFSLKTMTEKYLELYKRLKS